MTNQQRQLSQSNVWQTLQQLSQKDWCLKQLFNKQADRGKSYCAEACGIYLDYSKQRLDDDVLSFLYQLADDVKLAEKIKALQTGCPINQTENRPALHTALRLPKETSLWLDGRDIVLDVHESLQKAEAIVEKIRQKTWRGFSGKAITDVVNIGVGGSDLGPVMAVTALEEWASTEISVHFISNMDGSQLASRLRQLNPETTLFIISSKSFTTADTFSNAKTAMAWLQMSCPNKDTLLKHHFIGVSACPEKMQDWGLPHSNQLRFWQWVGGRFSMWSVIGLAIAIKIGMPNFRLLLEGAYEMDKHFANTPFHKNLPVLLGLIGVWNSTFLHIHAHTVLPYDGRLKYFPNYLMQLEMESNGKSVSMLGETLTYHTAPVMWGDVGSNAQHAFYQLLHQGTQQVSCDFIAPIHRQDAPPTYHQQKHSGQKHCASIATTSKNGKYASIYENLQTQHQLVLANCLAQSRVLAFGNQSIADNGLVNVNDEHHQQNKHKIYRGNQPSSTLLFNELNPFTLGSLTALYEHKVFVMAMLWQINPFDQWGVEVGKVMANQLFECICHHETGGFDSSTNQLLTKIKGS